MPTNHALRFESYGPPSVLSLQELPISEIKPGEVLVEVHASAINPSDVKAVSGHFSSSLPRVPGRDYAGVVVSQGPWKGKEVWGSGPGFGITLDGAHARYLVVPSDALSEKPSELTMEQASSVGVPYLAAWSGLVDAANIRAGETVLITGASGAVGRATTQIAKWKGATVIAADRNQPHSNFDHFVDTNKQDLPAEVKALTSGRGANVVFDAVGGPLFEPALKSLAVDGRQVVITSVGNRRVEFDLIDFYHKRLRLIGVDTAQLTGPQIAGIMDQLRAGFEDGAFQPSAVKTWTLDQAVEAYTAVVNGDATVKHILVPK